MGDPKIFECAWCVQHGAVQGWLHLRPEQVRKALQACQGPEVRRSEDDLREHPQVRSHGLVSEGGQPANKKCQCKKGFSGNGFQCKDDKTGDWATNPSGEVEMTIEADSKFWIYPQGSDLFPTL